MKFGVYVGAVNPAYSHGEQVDRWARTMRVAHESGFRSVVAVHHWLSHPAAMLQPMPLLARLAAEPGDLQLITSVVQLPLYSPVDMAEQVVTVDVISGGRLVLGVGLGYREKLFEAAGARKQDRAARLEESIEIMKRLWSGEAVTYRGKYFRVTEGRLGMLPVQKPHPPIWMGAQSDRGVRRAGRMADSWLIPPQATFQEIERLMVIYRDELARAGKPFPSELALMRSMTIAPTRARALELARSELDDIYAFYRPLGLQERSTVRLDLPVEEEVLNRAIVGSPDDCVEKLNTYVTTFGANHFILRLGKPGTTSFQADETIRLLGREVLPYVKEPVEAGAG
jgi:alkanesulfonate monooxygenase SsuD/methylene tetrahydromethanopterin reductase-like flavin-dependent oxidoreductase (luciferase family)